MVLTLQPLLILDHLQHLAAILIILEWLLFLLILEQLQHLAVILVILAGLLFPLILQHLNHRHLL